MKVLRLSIHGNPRFRVDCGVIDGKRKQRTFSNQKDASEFLKLAKREKLEAGNRGLRSFLSILDSERQDIINARQLKETGQVKATWEEILHFYLKNRDQSKLPEVRIQDAVATFLKQKSTQTKPRKLSDRYIEELTYQLEAFSAAYSTHKIRDFSADTIAEYLNDFENSYTFNNHRIALSMLFDFSTKNKWLSDSPCNSIGKAALSEQAPEIYTNDEATKLLLTAAADEVLRPILPAYAIGFFAFLRIAEIKRLDRSEIKLRNQHPMITVAAAKAKTRSLRNVAMSPNLRSILEKCNLPDGPITPSDFDWKREKLHEKARVPIKRNGLRHTGASNHCVRPFQLSYPAEDTALTSAMLGHRNPDMLFRHYRALIDPVDGLEYWQISPFPIN